MSRGEERGIGGTLPRADEAAREAQARRYSEPHSGIEAPWKIAALFHFVNYRVSERHDLTQFGSTDRTLEAVRNQKHCFEDGPLRPLIGFQFPK